MSQSEFNIAAKMGDLDNIKKLIETQDVKAIEDAYILAATYGKLEVVKYFVSRGVNVYAGEAHALINARANAYDEVVEYLESLGMDEYAIPNVDFDNLDNNIKSILKPFLEYIKLLNIDLKSTLHRYTLNPDSINKNYQVKEVVESIFKSAPNMTDSLTVYRGITTMYTPKYNFMSTSLDKNIALSFFKSQSKCCLYEIKLLPGAYSILPLMLLSAYPNEMEILLPPGRLDIQSVVKKDKMIEKVKCIFVPYSNDQNDDPKTPSIDEWMSKLISLKEVLYIICKKLTAECITAELKETDIYDLLPKEALDKFIQLFTNISEKWIREQQKSDMTRLINLGIKIDMSNYFSWKKFLDYLQPLPSNLTPDYILDTAAQLQIEDIINELLDSNIEFNNVETIILNKIKNKSIIDKMVKRLDFNKIDENGDTVLIKFAKTVKKLKLLELLLPYNLDLNKQNKKGDTLLITLVKDKRSDSYLLTKLLESGADINITNQKNQDALLLYIERPVTNITKEMEDLVDKMLERYTRSIDKVIRHALKYKNIFMLERVLQKYPQSRQVIEDYSSRSKSWKHILEKINVPLV